MAETNIETIKKRVRKLLSLSKSPNPNEAESALNKATALMSEYNLSESECAEITMTAAKGVYDLNHWKVRLATAVSWLYNCEFFFSRKDRGCDFKFCGIEVYSFMAKEMYTYLSKSVERVAKEKIRKNAKTKYRNSFKMGIVKGLILKIYTLGDAVSWAPERDKNKKQIEEYLNKNLDLVKRKNKVKSTPTNSTAMNKGLSASSEISLNRQTTGHGNRFIESDLR